VELFPYLLDFNHTSSAGKPSNQSCARNSWWFGFFIKERRPNVAWTSYQIVLIFFCGIAGMLSVFCGHAIFSIAVEMLVNDILNLLAPSIIWVVRLQYICSLLSVISLLFFVFETSVRYNLAPSVDSDEKSS
jgi:hypothetical protein